VLVDRANQYIYNRDVAEAAIEINTY